jgi:ABC-type multidrug transport system ATPase subunit
LQIADCKLRRIVKEYSICEEWTQTQLNSNFLSIRVRPRPITKEVAMPNTAFVIAVSGPSGAGKSTVVRTLAARLGEAMALYFDDWPAQSTPT